MVSFLQIFCFLLVQTQMVFATLRFTPPSFIPYRDIPYFSELDTVTLIKWDFVLLYF